MSLERHVIRAAAVAVVAVLAALAAVAAAQPQAARSSGVPLRPLQTGVMDPPSFVGDDAAVAFKRTRAAGATIARLWVDWSFIAPGPKKPNDFDPSDPDDSYYRWGAVDTQVKDAVAAGLDPILVVVNAPEWAAASGRKLRPQDGPRTPDPEEYGVFAKAAAMHYSGDTPGIPRVRYWQAWNEPNVSMFLMPQTANGKPVSPDWYRKLLNAFTDAVHSVHKDNLSLGGALAPFTVKNPAVETVSPLTFMRALLCVSADKVPKPTCADKVRFDVWTQHPYTSGNATHHAYNPNDVSLGDMNEIRPILNAAKRSGRLVSPRGPLFWVTEFSWDTSPPDPHAVPVLLQARWTAEALYRMWDAGVTLVTWFTLRDGPYPANDYQSGLYYRGRTIAQDRAKPTLTAFRFPFVAYAVKGKVSYWGRVPTSRAARVRIETKLPGNSQWRRRRVVSANRFGIFAGTLPIGAKTGYVRAVAGGSSSLGFSLTVPPDRAVTPFGVGPHK